jgi:TolA-binding protein
MLETSQQFYLIAAFVVVLGLTIFGFFMREGVATSNIYQKGVKLYQEKDYKGAESAFRNVLSRHPSNDMVHLLLGDVLMQEDKLEEAIAQFREVIRRAPKNVDAYLRLGNALVKQDKLAEAIASVEKARDLFKAQRNPQKANQIDQLLQQMIAQ